MEPILTRRGYRCDLCLAYEPNDDYLCFIQPYENKRRLDALRSLPS